MLESLLGCESLVHLPLKALVNKIDEEVITLKHFGQALGVRVSDPTLRVRVL